MARYRIHVGQVEVEVESPLTSVDAVRAAVIAGEIPDAAYYAEHTAPIHSITLVSGGEDASDAGDARNDEGVQSGDAALGLEARPEGDVAVASDSDRPVGETASTPEALNA